MTTGCQSANLQHTDNDRLKVCKLWANRQTANLQAKKTDCKPSGNKDRLSVCKSQVNRWQQTVSLQTFRQQTMTLSVCKPQVNRQWQSAANLQATDNDTVSLQTTSQQTMTVSCKPSGNRQCHYPFANHKPTDDNRMSVCETTRQQTMTDHQFANLQATDSGSQSVGLQLARDGRRTLTSDWADQTQWCPSSSQVCSISHTMPYADERLHGTQDNQKWPFLQLSETSSVPQRHLFLRTTGNNHFSGCLKRLVFHSITLLVHRTTRNGHFSSCLQCLVFHSITSLIHRTTRNDHFSSCLKCLAFHSVTFLE